MLGLCEPGDEVVDFEPYYDSYPAGSRWPARAPVVPLRRPRTGVRRRASWAAAITPRTRRVLLNTPHNPTGKVFARAELRLAERCLEHDLSRSPTRSTSTSSSTASMSRSRPCPGWRAHHHGLVGREDLLVHRLEDRLGLRPGLRSLTPCAPSSSSSPTSTARPSSPPCPARSGLPDAYFAVSGGGHEGATGSVL